MNNLWDYSQFNDDLNLWLITDGNTVYRTGSELAASTLCALLNLHAFDPSQP